MGQLDFIIIGAYFVGLLTIGWLNRRGQASAEDFFVGGRRIPWYAVLGSIIGTEISAATFLGVTSLGYSSNFYYLQFGIGSLLARFAVAYLFITAYYRSNYISIYQYLRERFGAGSHYTASVYFIITRLLASSVRLLFAAIGFSAVFNVSITTCILVFTLVAVAYTLVGGIKAVIWTDCLQALVFVSAGVAAFAFIVSQIGWDAIVSFGQTENRFEFFKFSPVGSSVGEGGANGWMRWLNEPDLFYSSLLFGFLSTTAALGIDQDLTQRMLSCKNVRAARRSVILSGFIGIPIAAFFLFLGMSIAAYLGQPAAAALLPAEIANDKVFPYFIANVLPSGLKGLLLCGILAAAMSSLDSAMNALSSSAVTDLVRPLLRNRDETGDEGIVVLSRWLTLLFAFSLAALAILFQEQGDLIWFAFQIVSLTYCGLLGVFLVGLLTQRGRDSINVVAMLSGSAVTGILLTLGKLEKIGLSWSWFLLIGTVVTFFIAVLPSNSSKSRSDEPVALP